MKAIITINYTEFLVPCAKKALAFVEMTEKAQVVARGSTYVRDEIRLSGDTARIEMCVVPPTAKIIPAKAQPKKKEV
jgi:hypothetical protein